MACRAFCQRARFSGESSLSERMAIIGGRNLTLAAKSRQVERPQFADLSPRGARPPPSRHRLVALIAAIFHIGPDELGETGIFLFGVFAKIKRSVFEEHRENESRSKKQHKPENRAEKSHKNERAPQLSQEARHGNVENVRCQRVRAGAGNPRLASP